MNKPREGNRPNPYTLPERDAVESSGHSLVRKMESGLAEPTRDTMRNRQLANDNGWTEAEYNHWVDTGDPPIRSHVKSTPATRADEIDDDERLHHGN